MKPIEALADAIMQFEGWHRDSRSWRNRNPGNLRPLGTQPAEDGYRTFPTMAEGWIALRRDLAAKFGGSHGLTADSSLLDLLNVYAPAGDANNPAAYTLFICAWTSRILGRPVRPDTALHVYLAGETPDQGV